MSPNTYWNRDQEERISVLAVQGVGVGGEVDIDKQVPDTHMQPYSQQSPSSQWRMQIQNADTNTDTDANTNTNTDKKTRIKVTGLTPSDNRIGLTRTANHTFFSEMSCRTSISNYTPTLFTHSIGESDQVIPYHPVLHQASSFPWSVESINDLLFFVNYFFHLSIWILNNEKSSLSIDGVNKWSPSSRPPQIGNIKQRC